MNRKDTESLYQEARRFGIELSLQHLNRFGLYIDELMEWNRRINLTGLYEPRRITRELLLDSLLTASLLPEDGRMLDVGSGAGFPGMVIKIYRPDLKVHLLEATSRKGTFLRHMVRLLGLKGIEVKKGRIEREGHDLPEEGYDIITARALASLDRVMVWCTPFLAYNGLLVGFLGKDSDAILKKCDPLKKAHSLELYKKVDYTLPGKDFTRTIVIFRKGLSPKGTCG